MKYSFYEIWNKALEGREERVLKQRDHIWASEIGGSFVDRYLKMNAVIPSNPPNPRSLRKFEAGNLMEWIVGIVLKRAGIALDNQKWLAFQYPGLLKVTGKYDYLMGGKPDFEKVKQVIGDLQLPDFFSRGAEAMIKYFLEKFPDGLDEIILEVKSCSSFMYERYAKVGASKQHILQLFHYLKADDREEGQLAYISKDDLRMLGFGLTKNSLDVESKYRADIEKMTQYINAKEQPPLEKPIVFNDDTFRFSTNFKVAYSNYLTMLYGIESQFEFDNMYKKKVGSWNRVLTRCVKDSKMTKLNVEVIDEIKGSFPDFDDYVSKAKEAKVETDENIEDEKEEN